MDNNKKIWIRKIYDSGESRIITIPYKLKKLTEATFVVFSVKDDGTIVVEPFEHKGGR